jgi:hypothetical protein
MMKLVTAFSLLPPTEADCIQELLGLDGDSIACRSCGDHLGLYVVRGRYHGLCAPCTLARIGSLSARSAHLPEWVRLLEGAVLREIRSKERKSREALQVTWGNLIKCAICHRMMMIADARYHSGSPGVPIPPHCPACYESGRRAESQ